MYHDKKHVHIFDFKNPVAVFSEKEGIFRFCDESASVTISGSNVRALEKIRDSIDSYLKGKK